MKSKNRKRTGRPPLPKGVAKGWVLQVRLPSALRPEAERIAKAAGAESPSDWARGLIVGAIHADAAGEALLREMGIDPL